MKGSIVRMKTKYGGNTFEEDLNELLEEDPEFAKEWEKIQPELNMISALLEARKSKNLTQKQLAELSGIDQSDISKIERGVANPTVKQLQRLADAIDMNLSITFTPKTK